MHFTLQIAAALVDLAIGVTLLSELDVPFIKIGRRCVYDRLDLDQWLDEYKQREHWRAGKERTLWPVKTESIGDWIPGSGGLQQRSRIELEHAKVLGLKTGKIPKPC